jgi:FkbM family methyltransferase
VQVRCCLEKIGTDYGGYALDASRITKDAVVYSLGVGSDISFDLALIQKLGVTVHAFDPTPKVKDWLATQKLPQEFQFLDIGISDFDGDGVFYLPPRQDYISHSLIRARQYSRESIRVHFIRLGTAMKRLGHERIDLLKMDIEGAEYAVIADLVKEKIHVSQILVEFHHRLSSIGTKRTRRALSLLESLGLKICYVCPRMEVFTLIRDSEGNASVHETRVDY